MKCLSRLAPCLFALAVTAGCASSTVTSRQSNVGDEKLARPDRILVYDFAASPADVPPGSVAATRYTAYNTPSTPEALEAGRKLGAQVAEELAAEIRQMGLPGEHAARETKPGVGDIVIRGYFETVDKGSAVERVALGFGAGAAELRTMVEGYQMTPQGLRLLGSGEIDSGGGKAPGMILPLIVTAATANPIGLAVGGAVKVATEASGADTIKGAAKRTAKQIADELRVAFEKQGWID